jgi:hypothetical protein
MHHITACADELYALPTSPKSAPARRWALLTAFQDPRTACTRLAQLHVGVIKGGASVHTAFPFCHNIRAVRFWPSNKTTAQAIGRPKKQQNLHSSLFIAFPTPLQRRKQPARPSTSPQCRVQTPFLTLFSSMTDHPIQQSTAHSSRATLRLDPLPCPAPYTRRNPHPRRLSDHAASEMAAPGEACLSHLLLGLGGFYSGALGPGD